MSIRIPAKMYPKHGALLAATAGGSGDDTKVTSAEIDRNVSGSLSNSAKLMLDYSAALGSGSTLSFTVGIIDCDTAGGSYGDAVSLLAKTAISTGGTGGTTNTGVYDLDVDLAARKRYIKFEVTPDLSRDGTDTLDGAIVVGLADFDVEPV